MTPKQEKPTGRRETENDLLRWLRDLDPQLEHWLGDDTALLPASGPRAVTVDSQIEGTHFLPGLDEAVIARRLLAVNLSDLAAAGAEPAHCLLSLSAPPTFDHRRFFRAFVEECRRWNLQLVGGDLARTDKVVASLTAFGDLPDAGRWLRRSAAMPGDRIWLGGTVGESATGRHLLAAGARWAPDETSDRTSDRSSDGTEGAPQVPQEVSEKLGLHSEELREAARRAVTRHLLPQPQIALGRWLGGHGRAAAIDLSDGLVMDLARLNEASGTGARLRLDDLPLPSCHAPLLEALGQSPLEAALAGGEDYVLLFTLPAEDSPPAEYGCHVIGSVTEKTGIEWVGEDAPRAAEMEGWDHLGNRP